ANGHRAGRGRLGHVLLDVGRDRLRRHRDRVRFRLGGAGPRVAGVQPPAGRGVRRKVWAVDMKLGAYTAILHDKPLPEALRVLAELGLESAEINSGGFLPAPHLPIAEIRESAGAREEYLGAFASAGL